MRRPNTRGGAALAALVSLALLSACGGPKRPPVTATAPPDASAGASSDGRYGSTPQPIEMEPDVRSVGSDGIGQEGLSYSGPDGEGGPLEDVLFAFDESALSDQGRALLERHALWLQTHREAQVTIEGHCDERGTVEYNLALGDLRSQAARDYLVSLGVAPERLSAVSYGKERPLDPGNGEQAWARNRRAHFVVRR